MYLLDTDVVSELREKERNAGVAAFVSRATEGKLYVSVISLGKLRYGVERIRWRGDATQADVLDVWLGQMMEIFSGHVIPFDAECAHVWGRMRVPNEENAIDKQIASIARVNDLTLVTRYTTHYLSTGVQLENPFA